jgi:uncharacterized protein
VPFPDNAKFARVRVARLWLWPLAGSLSLALAYVFTARGGELPFVPLAYTAYAFFLLAALRSLREAEIHPGELFGLPPDSVKSWPLVILLVPVMFTFAAMTLWATAFAASWMSPRFAEYLLKEQNDPGPLGSMTESGSALLILFVVVVGPVIEEFIFRGLVLRRWIARRSLWRGVIGSALVFALLHPPFWIGAFVIGVFLALLYLVTRSLYAPIAFHAMYNGLIAFAMVAADDAATDDRPKTVAAFREQWMGETVLLLISGWIIWRVIRALGVAARKNADEVAGVPPAAGAG